MTIAPMRGMLRPSGTVKLVFDGNSLMASQMPSKVAALSPLVGSGATYVNLGIGAQTLRMMNGLDGGSADDVNGAWEAGKRNVLVIWEASNAIAYFGRTVPQGIQDLIDYIAARRTLHPWQVVLLTCIPRFQPNQGGTYGHDVDLVEFNRRARLEYRSWGVDVLADVRAPGSVFDFDGTVAANFTATQSLWAEGSDWVHLSDAGYAVVAECVAAALRRLPARSTS
jgi:hypothetical protein